MSVTRVQLVGNVSTGASFAGIVTATSFIGNVTGTASTASFATTSFGLSGTPNITVGTIGATSLNASGVVTATSFSGSGANLTGIATTENVRTNSLVVSGVSTLGTVVVGGATTQLIVTGNARVTGILTIGTGSITLNGTSNIINVGTGLTLGSSGINVTGVITATSFVGDGSGLTGVGIGTNGSVNTTGIITATSVNDSIGNVRDIPQNSQISAYQLQSTDAGKHISITTGGITVPSSVFSVGDAVSIYNNSVSNQTITQGASVTLRQVGTANTGNRTLAQYGLATVLCVASNTFAISGGGLS